MSCENGGAPGETRTHTVRVLSPLPLPIGIRGRGAASIAAANDLNRRLESAVDSVPDDGHRAPEMGKYREGDAG